LTPWVIFFTKMRESQIAITRAKIINPSEIIPICFAFGSFDFRYLIVQPIKSGGRRTLTRYNPICINTPVERGFSLIFFPHVGQKNAVASTREEQNGQAIWVAGTGSISIYYHRSVVYYVYRKEIK